jgi:hypothetical protein
MFPVNSKVVVLGSNADSKAAPRVGSVGFVSSSNPDNLFRMPDYPYESAINLRVAFYRFGYQQKQRHEMKWCHAVLPSIKLNRTTPDVLEGTYRVVLGPAPCGVLGFGEPEVEALCSVASLVCSGALNSIVSEATQRGTTEKKLREISPHLRNTSALSVIRSLVTKRVKHGKVLRKLIDLRRKDSGTFTAVVFLVNTLKALVLAKENSVVIDFDSINPTYRQPHSANAKALANLFKDNAFEQWLKYADQEDQIRGIRQVLIERAAQIISKN